MNIAVVSDSHGYVRHLSELFWLQTALPKSERPEVLLHLGDGLRDIDRAEIPSDVAVLAVRGNCDGFGSFETLCERTLSFEGIRILMMHGHNLYVKSGISRAIAYAVEKNVDILLYGHTHEPFAQTIAAGATVGEKVLAKPLYVFNPGSLMEKSFGILKLSNKGILMSHGNL